MPDFNIKFSYKKGIGQQAANIRQRVLQSRKGMTGAQTAGMGQSPVSRDTLSNIKRLNSSIQKLIASNKDLMKAISGGGAGGGIGRGVGAATGAASRLGGGKALGGALVGLGAIGFTIQKINQVANAYNEKMAQQLTTIGTAGFRRGQGIFKGAQIAAGMKEYAQATGRFAATYVPGKTKTVEVAPGTDVWEERTVRGERYKKTSAPKTALDIASIYGISPGEALRTAGQFQRAGANYRTAAFTGVGAGIQTELPVFLQGMAGILTDAVREGVNTSNMSEDMAKNLAAITQKTPGKSVEAALNIVKSFQGVRKQVAAGKLGTTQGLFATQATQELLMEKLTGAGGKDYISDLEKQGVISKRQAEAFRGLPEGPTSFETLQKLAPGAAFPLMRKFAAEAPMGSIQKRTIQIAKKKFGEGAEGFQRFSDFAMSQGWAESQNQLETLWRTGEMPSTTMEKGRKGIETRARDVRRGPAGRQATREIARENIVFTYGESFSKTAMNMEKAMLQLAQTALPAATSGLDKLNKSASKFSDFIKNSGLFE